MAQAPQDAFIGGARPTLAQRATFTLKACGLRLKRLARNLFGPTRVRRHRHAGEDGVLIAQSVSPLWDPSANAAERALQAGKTQNLRVAARRLDGVRIGAGETFSFWRQVGRATARAGFAVGRELRHGCLIPTLGGGLCQLSNALHDCALKAGFDILERHAHTQSIPGSAFEAGRDATVFWNYVDLRFAAPHAFQIRVDLTAETLVVAFWTATP